jgi:potassium channel subfamily K, other eukaryote
MNDPGLDRPMKKAAEDLESDPYEHDQKQEEEDEQNFLNPGYAFNNGLLRGSNWS